MDNDNLQSPVTAQLTAMVTRLVQVEQCIVGANRRASEVVWSHILDDTIRESRWITNKELLPHRYVSGHQTLYVLYRILNENRPKRIWCVGQSAMSQVVSQYAHSDNGVEVLNTESGGDKFCDLICVEIGQSVLVPSPMKISERGTIIIDDTCRKLNNDDVAKYANLIHDARGATVVGRYEGIGMCYVVTGKGNAYLASM